MENQNGIIYGGDYDDDHKNAPLDDGLGSLGALILRDLEMGGDRPVLINGSTYQKITYKELRENSIKCSKVLHAAGLRSGDGISIVSESRFEFIEIVLGALYLNIIVAPLNVTYSQRELKHALTLSRPKIIFTSKYAEQKLISIAKDLNFIDKVVLFDSDAGNDSKAISYKNFTSKFYTENVEEFLACNVDIKEQISFIMMSSGTTGMPKGVLQSQENILSIIQSYRPIFKLLNMIYDKTPVMLNIAPWFHGFGLIYIILIACSREVCSVFLPKFEEEAFYRSIEKYQVNSVMLVPAVMVMLAKSSIFNKYDLSSIKDIACSTAALSRDIEEKVKERFKDEINIRQGYGLTEATFGLISGVGNLKPGSVGQPVKGVYVKVIDEKGKILGPNEPGELCFKSARIMKGYINDKKSTDDAIRDGWLHTGDIGYYDEDFDFFIIDRIKELIKYKGFQVPPSELESLLLTNPKILDCGVIGIADEAAGELPFAFVVRQPNVELTEHEVKKFVEENASNAKWLRGGVRFVDEIPKNSTGKILRTELRKMYKNLKAKL